MNKNKYYYNYYLSWYEINLDEGLKKSLDKNIWEYILNDKNILEIWFWKWTFANLCKSKWVINYIWLEIDEKMSQVWQCFFKDYKIIFEDVFDYLKNTTNTFDIIFMSHVFEHFTIEEWIELSKLINSHLDSNWIWINIMPNAWSISSSFARYNDITHKQIYTSDSFNQVLLLWNFSTNRIRHLNTFINYWLLWFIYLFIHPIRIILLKLIWWYSKIYSFEILSFIRK